MTDYRRSKHDSQPGRVTVLLAPTGLYRARAIERPPSLPGPLASVPTWYSVVEETRLLRNYLNHLYTIRIGVAIRE